jgi:hypothetical protein
MPESPNGQKYPERPRSPIPAWAVGIAVAGLCCVCCFPLTAIMYPILSQVKAAGLKTTELANVKEICLGAAAYAEDHDGYFPPDTASAFKMRDVLAKYTPDISIFRTINPGGGEILGNPALGGLSGAALAMPERVVFVYDSLAWPDGGAVAGFADFHATDTESMAQIQDLLTTPPKKQIEPKTSL